jgi:hypothetical protein
MFPVGFSCGRAGGRCKRLMSAGTSSSRVPAGLVYGEHGVRASRDATTDLVQVMLHGLGVGRRASRSESPHPGPLPNGERGKQHGVERDMPGTP